MTSGDLDSVAGESQLATWSCTGSPCPWGSSLSNHAVAWPETADPLAARLGYTASPAIYLPAASANGATVAIDDGSASLYAGAPAADSHRWLTTLSAGQSYLVSGIADGEVLSVQSDAEFEYHVTPPAPADPPPDDGGGGGDDGGGDVGNGGGGDGGGGGGDPPATSQLATWSCTGSPCPWGDVLSGQALAWPADAAPIDSRLGYTVDPGVYLPAARANGAIIAIEAGSASAFAGRPDDSSHRFLGSASPGQSLHVAGLVSGEVLSVQSDAAFSYHVSLPPPGDPDPDPGPDPDAVASIHALWNCDAPDCHGDPWIGEVINWPSWAAYHNNARAGDQARAVFADDGTALYPYMGLWAQGCEITARSGTVLIIEWQRGTDVWRATPLSPGETHVIDLIPPEDGAMIETYDGYPGFSVSLANCTPQPIGP